MGSKFVDYYQQYYLQSNPPPGALLCGFTVKQAMYIDSSITIPQQYTTNTLEFSIYTDQICSRRTNEPFADKCQPYTQP
jgi:hypothetical protein